MSEKKPTQLMDCVRVVCRQCQLQDSSVRALATFRQPERRLRTACRRGDLWVMEHGAGGVGAGTATQRWRD